MEPCKPHVSSHENLIGAKCLCSYCYPVFCSLFSCLFCTLCPPILIHPPTHPSERTIRILWTHANRMALVYLELGFFSELLHSTPGGLEMWELAGPKTLVPVLVALYPSRLYEKQWPGYEAKPFGAYWLLAGWTKTNSRASEPIYQCFSTSSLNWSHSQQ